MHFILHNRAQKSFRGDTRGRPFRCISVRSRLIGAISIPLSKRGSGITLRAGTRFGAKLRHYFGRSVAFSKARFYFDSTLTNQPSTHGPPGGTSIRPPRKCYTESQANTLAMTTQASFLLILPRFIPSDMLTRKGLT